MENIESTAPEVSSDISSEKLIKRLRGTVIWIRLSSVFFICTGGVLLYGVVTALSYGGYEPIMVAIYTAVGVLFLVQAFLLISASGKMGSKNPEVAMAGLKTFRMFWVIFSIVGIFLSIGLIKAVLFGL